MQAAKRYIPAWPGIETFKGVVHHSSFWPDEGTAVQGKKVAVICTGASGVQISQEWGQQHVGALTLFQRTLLMNRKALTPEEQAFAQASWYPRLFQMHEGSFAGFLYDFSEKETFEDTPEEREVFYQMLWDTAGFNFWLANYKDLLKNPEANTEAYNFWAKKVRKRVTDPKKKDLLAPLRMPHYFGEFERFLARWYS